LGSSGSMIDQDSSLSQKSWGMFLMIQIAPDAPLNHNYRFLALPYG
jgi:hypothetical protein